LTAICSKEKHGTENKWEKESVENKKFYFCKIYSMLDNKDIMNAKRAMK
jgi:hypothetical protein